MKHLFYKKLLFPVILILALSIGFGSSFALASRNDRVNNLEHSSQNHDSDQNHNQNDGDHSEGTNHSGVQNVSISSDSSVKEVKADKNVDLQNQTASPAEVFLTVGQVLQFNTKDNQIHRIAVGEGGSEHQHASATDSGDFGANEAWRVRFDRVGTYFFHDHHNPKINILVVVYQPGAKQGI